MRMHFKMSQIAVIYIYIICAQPTTHEYNCNCLLQACNLLVNCNVPITRQCQTAAATVAQAQQLQHYTASISYTIEAIIENLQTKLPIGCRKRALRRRMLECWLDKCTGPSRCRNWRWWLPKLVRMWISCAMASHTAVNIIYTLL